MTLETVMLIAANKPIKLSVVMLIVVSPEVDDCAVDAILDAQMNKLRRKETWRARSHYDLKQP